MFLVYILDEGVLAKVRISVVSLWICLSRRCSSAVVDRNDLRVGGWSLVVLFLQAVEITSGAVELSVE